MPDSIRLLTNLAGGYHIVSFANIVGWLAPSSLAVTVTANITNTFAGNYLEGSTPGAITWINIGGGRINIGAPLPIGI